MHFIFSGQCNDRIGNVFKKRLKTKRWNSQTNKTKKIEHMTKFLVGKGVV